MKRPFRYFFMGLLVLTPLYSASPGSSQNATSIDQQGIHARILQQPPYNLSGRKIGIGQMEIGRPGLVGFDKISLKNQFIRPTAVFLRDGLAQKDFQVDDHAHNVAGIMISQDKRSLGVAPQARLYSTAIGRLGRSGQPEECRSANYLALQNGGDVRAINLSFGESLGQDPRPNARLDGNALLTLCLDWSARVHNVVYVIAGNQGDGGIPIPTDNFNGLNVAFTRQDQGVFRQVDFANLGNELVSIAQRREGKERNLEGRRSISLVAPGSQLDLINPDGSISQASGTSFAAPHVTATIALLQEYADRRLRQAVPGAPISSWSVDSHQHQVMRAVLLNSADKLADRGDGMSLGMSRNIVNPRGLTWLELEAFRNAEMPLDLQMGAGQLNAFRAYQQFSAGQYPPPQPTPALGWSYQPTPSTTTPHEYEFAVPLEQGSYFVATLSWDRWVTLNDANGNGEFDFGETFSDGGLNNLDLYLLPSSGTTLQDAVCSSVSPVDSIEHLFCQIPRSDRYRLRVVQSQSVHNNPEFYGLAWWGKSVQTQPPSTPPSP